MRMTNETAKNLLTQMKNDVSWKPNVKTAFTKAIKALGDNKWISVKDRMPKDGEWVLCQLDDEFYDENTMMVLYHTDDWGEKWVDGGLGTGSYDVCAWMPLPKPYVKEVEE